MYHVYLDLHVVPLQTVQIICFKKSKKTLALCIAACYYNGRAGPKGIKNADVAQLAEQLICNQQVIGSSPIIGFFGPLAQLVRATGS